MKRVLFFVMIITLPHVISSESSDSLEALYQQGAYQEIINTYGAMSHNNAATWYVMGNAAYCLQQYSYAYLYWLRAQQYGNAYIYYATEKNIQLLSNQGFVPPVYKVYTWLVWLSKYVGIYILQIIFLFVWYVLCVMLYKRWRPLFVAGVILLVSGLLAPIIATYGFHQEKGLVMEDATMYNGPNNAYYTVGSVPKGTLVKVKDMQDDWIKVLYNDTIGWIGRTYVGLLGIHELEVKTSNRSIVQKKN